MIGINQLYFKLILFHLPSFPFLPFISNVYKTLNLLTTLVHTHHHSLHLHVQCTQLCALCTRQHEGKQVGLGLQMTLWVLMSITSNITVALPPMMQTQYTNTHIMKGLQTM